MEEEGHDHHHRHHSKKKGEKHGKHSKKGSKDDDFTSESKYDTPTKSPKSSKKSHTHKGKESFKSSSTKPLFDEYYSQDQIELGLESGEIVSGILRVNPNKRHEAYIKVDGVSIDVSIPTEHDRNRAQHGDKVFIQINSELAWNPINDTKDLEATLKLNENCYSDGIEKGKVNDHIWKPNEQIMNRFAHSEHHVSSSDSKKVKPLEARIQKASGSLQPTGKVVGIARKATITDITGSIRLAGDNGAIFQTLDPKYSHMWIPNLSLPEGFREHAESLANIIFVADACHEWPIHSKMPIAENVRSLGEAGSIAAETKALLIENNVNTEPFTSEMLEPLYNFLHLSPESEQSELDEGPQAATPGWTIPPEEYEKRRDFRDYCIFTIDPSNAKDLDDALHILPCDDGTYEIGVHIADVTFFLEEGTLLDEEAKDRATSVYLVQKVIPMLPSVLCEQLCSLNPNVERLAFSCVFYLNEDGSLNSKKGYWFGKSIIKSCAKLDYATAQRMVDKLIPSTPALGSNDPDAHIHDLSDDIWEHKRRPPVETKHACWEVARDACLLHRIGMVRRHQRMSCGALELNQAKLNFVLDENGNPSSFFEYPIRETNKMVEEYMLLANYLAAEKMLKTVGGFAFLRRHVSPMLKGFRDLIEASEELGHKVDISSAHALQASLNYLSQHVSSVQLQVLTSLTMSSMSEAEYFVVDNIPSNLWKHFALAISYYTHFTSPIRRYADVTVHRLLNYGLELERLGKVDDTEYTQQTLTESKLKDLKWISENCNEKKRASKAAQDRSSDVFLAVYLRDHPIQCDDAVVISLGPKSFTLLIPQYGIRARKFVDRLPGMECEFDKEQRVLRLIPTTDGDSTGTGIVRLGFMTRIRVRLETCNTVPISYVVQFLGTVPDV